jgi:hypothetical protein
LPHFHRRHCATVVVIIFVVAIEDAYSSCVLIPGESEGLLICSSFERLRVGNHFNRLVSLDVMFSNDTMSFVDNDKAWSLLLFAGEGEVRQADSSVLPWRFLAGTSNARRLLSLLSLRDLVNWTTSRTMASPLKLSFWLFLLCLLFQRRGSYDKKVRTPPSMMVVVAGQEGNISCGSAAYRHHHHHHNSISAISWPHFQFLFWMFDFVHMKPHILHVGTIKRHIVQVNWWLTAPPVEVSDFCGEKNGKMATGGGSGPLACRSCCGEDGCRLTSKS